jgi:hypothetical protein
MSPRSNGRNLSLFCSFAVLFLFSCVSSAQDKNSSFMNQDSRADARADELVSQMTLDEKIQLVHGAFTSSTVPRGAAGFVPGIPRLGVPDLYFADGSVGAGNQVGPAWDTRMAESLEKNFLLTESTSTWAATST